MSGTAQATRWWWWQWKISGKFIWCHPLIAAPNIKSVFDQCLTISQKRCKPYLLWTANRNLYVLFKWWYIQWPWVTHKYPRPPQFVHFATSLIPLYQLEIETSNLVDRLTIASTSLWMTNHPWSECYHGHMTHSNFRGPNHIFGTVCVPCPRPHADTTLGPGCDLGNGRRCP